MSDYHDCDSRDDCDAAREERDELKAENERLRELMTRAEYYINRLEAVHRGHVVRDLDEAHNAWDTYKRRCEYQQDPAAK